MARPLSVYFAYLLVTGCLISGCKDDEALPVVRMDTISLPDGSVSFFLSPCEEDNDCASGHCVTLGSVKRCSRACSAADPCPSFAGWSCSPQSYCVCDFQGPQPEVCNVDGDCDGSADKVPVAESCNGEDDDCSGVADDNIPPGTSGATQYFGDDDGDGYGDDNDSVWSCVPVDGRVTVAEDCDDTREQDYPGAEEICGDGYDNDCDGATDEPEVCGLVPPSVPDVSGDYNSGTLKTCATSATIDDRIDITYILAKQDSVAIKFTVRLEGKPAISLQEGCSSYIFKFSNYKQALDLIFVYRPNTIECSLPALEAFLKGSPIATTAKGGFLAASPGHVSLTVDKQELFANLTTPTYQLQACTNLTADAVADLTACDDTCEVPVHR